MKKTVQLILVLLGVVLGVYVGLFQMFIFPIIQCCNAYDLGTLTGGLIGITVIKCLFASFVGYLIFYICTILAVMLD